MAGGHAPSQPHAMAPHASTPAVPPAEAARRAALLALDLKARDVVLLDLKGVTDMTDFFLIATGTSDTHVRAIAQHVELEMKRAGAPAHHVAGAAQGRWALRDFVDVVVHVFHPTLRQFYQLERLWGDAKQVPLEQPTAAAAR